MRQNLTQFAAGSAAVMATLIAGHFVIGNSPAKAETFDTRWTAVEPVQKGDRLDTKATLNESSVVFYSDPRLGVTIATKITRNESSNKARSTPIENAREERARNEKKLPVGCEPSFSPVTTPSMANVTGRCLSANETNVKVAALSR
jgi:hypothetical protein